MMTMARDNLMKKIELLDASLRDGGHRTNFHFQNEHLQHILEPLDNSGVEYIEIGYRNGSLHPIENLGRAGLCEKDYLHYCQSLIKKAKIAVMAHPKNINESDIKELQNYGVTLLRVCIAKNGLSEALPTIELAKKLNMGVSANFIHMSYYSDNELDKAIAEVSQMHPDMIYFADSNGAMTPKKIEDIYSRFTKIYSIPFGFHAHDNLGLAQANAIAAMNSGAYYIDTSLAGMGKGTGNLKTEFFIAYLEAMNHSTYDLSQALTAANYVRDVLHIGHEPIEMDEFVRGISDFSTADLKLYKLKK